MSTAFVASIVILALSSFGPDGLLGAQSLPPSAPAPAVDSTPSVVLLRQDMLIWRFLEPGVEIALLARCSSDTVEKGASRIKYADGYQSAIRSDSADRQITVISGVLAIGIGEKLDPTSLHYMPPGSYLLIPRNVSHFMRAVGETIIEVHEPRTVGVPEIAVGNARPVPAPGYAGSSAIPKPAATSAASPTAKSRLWTRSLGFSYSLSRGNADVTDGVLSAKAKRSGMRTRMQLQTLWRRGARDGTSTSHQFLSGIRLDQTLAWHLAALAKPSLLQEITYEVDKIQKLDNRTVLNAGLSVPIAGAGENVLALEAGGGLTCEHFDGVAPNIHKTGFFRLNSGQKLFGAAKFTQQMAALPDFDISGRYRFTGDVSLQAPLSKLISLQMVINSRYDTKPQPEVKPHDFTVMSGMGVDF